MKENFEKLNSVLEQEFDNLLTKEPIITKRFADILLNVNEVIKTATDIDIFEKNDIIYNENNITVDLIVKPKYFEDLKVGAKKYFITSHLLDSGTLNYYKKYLDNKEEPLSDDMISLISMIENTMKFQEKYNKQLMQIPTMQFTLDKTILEDDKPVFQYLFDLQKDNKDNAEKMASNYGLDIKLPENATEDQINIIKNDQEKFYDIINTYYKLIDTNIVNYYSMKHNQKVYNRINKKIIEFKDIDIAFVNQEYGKLVELTRKYKTTDITKFSKDIHFLSIRKDLIDKFGEETVGFDLYEFSMFLEIFHMRYHH